MGKIPSKPGSGGHNIKEYYVSLDMAKELSMVNHVSPTSVDAMDLWVFLEVETPFNKWIKHNIKKGGFIEGQDYVRLTNLSSERKIGSEHKIEYYVSLDMSKTPCFPYIRGCDGILSPQF